MGVGGWVWARVGDWAGDEDGDGVRVSVREWVRVRTTSRSSWSKPIWPPPPSPRVRFRMRVRMRIRNRIRIRIRIRTAVDINFRIHK